jgi:hypothetical protein
MITKQQVEIVTGTKEELLEHFKFINPRRIMFNVTDDGKLEQLLLFENDDKNKLKELIESTGRIGEYFGDSPIAYSIFPEKISSVESQLNNIISNNICIGIIFVMKQSVDKDKYINATLNNKNQNSISNEIPEETIRIESFYVRVMKKIEL